MKDVYFVGGFGVMGWVTPEDYTSAEPDPLADAADRILSHMNADHTDSLSLLARAHSSLEGTEAQMTAVDRLGFHMRLKTAEGMRGTRHSIQARSPQRQPSPRNPSRNGKRRQNLGACLNSRRSQV